VANIAVYTAMFGRYDYVPAPRRRRRDAGVDFICFVEREDRVQRGWHAVVVDPRELGGTATLANRALKLVGHQALSDYEAVIYVDGNVAVDGDPTEFVDAVLSDHGLALPVHARRSCVYDELELCRKQSLITDREFENHLHHLRGLGVPRHLGLTENFIVARRMGDRVVRDALAEVGQAVQGGPSRDQLHMQPILWSRDVRYRRVQRQELKPMFRSFPHRLRRDGLPAHTWPRSQLLEWATSRNDQVVVLRILEGLLKLDSLSRSLRRK
jgi:hypothetical protein